METLRKREEVASSLWKGGKLRPAEWERPELRTRVAAVLPRSVLHFSLAVFSLQVKPLPGAGQGHPPAWGFVIVRGDGDMRI